MKNFFKPEDFYMNPEFNERYEAARIANEKLAALIESWPVVYLKNNSIEYRGGELPWQDKSETHKAHLAFIEELPKEPCKHEPDLSPKNLTEKNYLQVAHLPLKVITNCKHCGVELQATWSEK